MMVSDSQFIGWFADLSLDDRPQVGGKGGSLGELERAGIAVPPGFVVKTAAFEQFLEALERSVPMRARVAALDPDDLTAVTELSQRLRAQVHAMPMPADITQAIGRAYEQL